MPCRWGPRYCSRDEHGCTEVERQSSTTTFLMTRAHDAVDCSLKSEGSRVALEMCRLPGASTPGGGRVCFLRTGQTRVLMRSLVSGLLGMVGETIEGWQGWVAEQLTTSA